VQKAILGIEGRTLTESIAKDHKVDFTQGVYIGDIVEGSGADKSDLQKGDIIKKVDYKKIKKFSDLVGYLDSKRPNETLKIEVSRNGKILNIPVTLSLTISPM